jgi:hypothetical protein
MRPKFQNTSPSRLITTHNPNIQNFFDCKNPNTNKQTNKQTKGKGQIKFALSLPKSTKLFS